MKFFKLPPQVLRLVLLTAVIVVSYLVARTLLTPASFREHGFYRGAALAELASIPPVFAGKKSCEECHSEEFEKLAKDSHRNLSCEGCHGVSLAHCANPEVKPPVPKPPMTVCVRCHEANPSRPASHHQIKVSNHYADQPCTECHVPHQPNEVP